MGKSKKSASGRMVQLPAGQDSTTKIIKAPAYFGESCLWDPMADCGTKPAPVHAYVAICLVRCEVVTVSRAAVKEIVEHFSPWLVDRFETFQQNVRQGLSEFGACSARSLPGQDLKSAPGQESAPT